MWEALMASKMTSTEVIEVMTTVKAVINANHFSRKMDKLASFSLDTLKETLMAVKEINPKYRLANLQDLTKFQLCQRLIWAFKTFTSSTAKCLICDEFYNLDFKAFDDGLTCFECSKPSHNICTKDLQLNLPKGFYWMCPDCDQEDDSASTMLTIFQKLRQSLDDSKNNSEEKVLRIKNEPGFEVESGSTAEDFIYDDEEDDEEDVKKDIIKDSEDDDDLVCFPQRGFLCDICQFCTFDHSEFMTHVEAEERQGGLVQDAISSQVNKKECIKCNEVCTNWSKLYEHVTKFHSRASDFPMFGDVEWKFLMSGGSLKRSCGYCGTHFNRMKEWIDHMRHNMGEDVAEPANDEESKVDVNVGLDDLDSDSISFELKCNECSIEQLFRSQDALKIHMSTFHKRSKRFLCAFCHFDGNTVKDLNSHINSEHEGNFNKCSECDFETWAHSVLRRHINMKHRNIKSYGCKHCSYTAMAKSTLIAHISREHALAAAATLPLAEESTLGQHYDTIRKPHLEFKCCFCDFKSTSKKSFQEHFDESHQGNRTQCLECDFKAPVISHLRRHIDSVHKGLKKFPCEMCHHRATTKQGLERHVRVKHLNLKDLKCPHCDYKTSAPDGLRMHAKKYHDVDAAAGDDKKDVKNRVYFGNRTAIPMVCRLCGEGTQTTNKLAAHFAECHPFEKPFWCHECNIGYETYYGIQNHTRKDHSEERHLCPICGYSTHGPQYLKRHYRRKHPGMFEAIQMQLENSNEDKISSDEKMRVALELKGLSDEEISEKVKALITLSEDGVWTCGQCQRRFDGKPKRALYSHIRERHFHMRHFKCKECNFLSYNRAEIQEHKNKHKQDKPIHQCDLCGFICDNNTGLIRHKRGRFCQNTHLQRRKRDREKMAKRMSMSYMQTAASEPVSNNADDKNNRGVVNDDEDSSITPRFPYGAHNLY